MFWMAESSAANPMGSAISHILPDVYDEQFSLVEAGHPSTSMINISVGIIDL